MTAWSWPEIPNSWVATFTLCLPGVFIAWQFFTGRLTRRQERRYELEDRRDAAVAKEREALALMNADLMNELHGQLDRCVVSKQVIEKDYEDERTFRRQAEEAAWTYMQEARHARQVAESMARQAEKIAQLARKDPEGVDCMTIEFPVWRTRLPDFVPHHQPTGTGT